MRKKLLNNLFLTIKQVFVNEFVIFICNSYKGNKGQELKALQQTK